jgi:phage tail-like protein
VLVTAGKSTVNKNQLSIGIVKSRLLEHLPAFYMEDEFMGQFLMIFQSIFDPIEHTVDSIPLYFDPRFVPESMLPWLASWLGLVMDPGWPLARRRELVSLGADLYRWRGTKRGLSEFLRIYTGSSPDIIEFIPGTPLDGTAKLGINTRLGSPGSGYHFTVTVNLGSGVNSDTIRTIIESQKPAHTVYTLQFKENTKDNLA